MTKHEPVDPRFTLASERTFLAWNRTALALIGGGIAITELLPHLNEHGARRALGIPLILFGGLLTLFADRRRINVQAALERGEGVPPSALPHVLTAVVAIVALVAVILIVFD